MTSCSFRIFLSITLFRFHSHILFFFNDTATTEIYTLSLHDALPIWLVYKGKKPVHWCIHCRTALAEAEVEYAVDRSEEHTSELQSHSDLGFRLLLEKRKWNRS